MLTIKEQQFPRFFRPEPFVNELLHICSLRLYPTLPPKFPFSTRPKSDH